LVLSQGLIFAVAFAAIGLAMSTPWAHVLFIWAAVMVGNVFVQWRGRRRTDRARIG
jgi:hypothetical protein